VRMRRLLWERRRRLAADGFENVRDANVHACPALGAVSVFRGAGRDCAVEGAGCRCQGGRAAAWEIAVDGLEGSCVANAATRCGKLEYRPSVAQWKAELMARRRRRRSSPADDRLREYVQERLCGRVSSPGRDCGAGTRNDAVEGPEQVAAPGSQVGDGVEP